jgi:DNA-binding transcriptional MerR regulator
MMKYKGIKKLYYSISEISEMFGIKQSVIRYWESEFKELKPQKNRAGNRIYKKDDIAILRMIYYYVYEKHLSIHEANDVITDLKNEGLYKRKLQELNKIDFTPAPLDEDLNEEPEPEDEQESEDEPEPEEDEDENVDPVVITYEEEDEEKEEESEPEEIEETVEKPLFEIVTPTQETFIYPLDELKNKDEEEEKEDERTEEELPESEDIPEPPAFAKTPAEPQPQPQPQPVKTQSDPELKALLKKISANIKDIIDILNE